MLRMLKEMQMLYLKKITETRKTGFLFLFDSGLNKRTFYKCNNIL